MRLGGICGSFNRAFDAGAMDQLAFLRHCATELRVTGRSSGTSSGVGVHNDFGVAEATWRQSEIATPTHFRRAGQSRADG